MPATRLRRLVLACSPTRPRALAVAGPLTATTRLRRLVLACSPTRPRALAVAGPRTATTRLRRLVLAGPLTPATRLCRLVLVCPLLSACALGGDPPPAPTASPVATRAVSAARPASALPRGGLDRAGYFAVADALAARLDGLWSARGGFYRAGPGTVTAVNADLLIVHSAAALAGHRGPARDDARAVAILRFLTGPAVWRGRRGWQAGPDNTDRHDVFQAEAIEALEAAYTARVPLGLDAALAQRVRARVARVARGRGRWPALILNQFNWYATYAHADAVVNGRARELATTLRRHLDRFLRRARAGAGHPGNFGGGLRFHYWTAGAASEPLNLDSAEYANIVLGFTRTYPRARAAGMPRPAGVRVLREWVRRAISGYWTHGGALNWDTGWGFERWQQRKKTGLAQAALIGIAAAPELQPSPRWGAWAKWLLDRGLTRYVALADREGRIPGALAYDVRTHPLDRGNAYLGASRVAANAVRAVAAGLGEQRAQRPPALYAFDPDTGRLAVTTPAYNTAIVPVSRGAFPYGGLDLARLLDSGPEVIGTLGGTGAAGFGLRVGTLRTQYGRRGPATSPLRLLRAPRGVGVDAAASARTLRAYAGPFRELRVRGTAPAGTVEYRFTPTRIEARWTARARGGVVTFPSYGHHARVRALRPGTFAIGGGYTVTLRGARATRIVRPRPQRANPDPGPTLEVALAGTELRATLIPR